MKDNSGKIMLALLAGASAGVIAGLLMAPDSGTATRDSLKKSASKLGKDLEKKLQEGMSKLEGLNTGGLMDQASSMIGGLTGKGGSNSDKSNSNASGSTSGSSASGSSAGSGSNTSGAGSTGSMGGGVNSGGSNA